MCDDWKMIQNDNNNTPYRARPPGYVNVGGDNYHKAKRDWSLFIQLSYR
jgi:hypothetical protein